MILRQSKGKRKSVKIFGTDYLTDDDNCIRDYIYICDLAKAHILGLDYLVEENKSDIFNLGNGRGFSVREIIEISKQVTEKSILVEECPRRLGDRAVLVGSNNKA